MLIKQENYQIWNTKILNKDEFNQLQTKEKLVYLCTAGHLAANSHNTQPWRFEINDNDFTINIYVLSNYILPASDPTGRQAIISIGCAVENIIQACNYFNLKYSLKTHTTEKEKINKKNIQDNQLIKIVSLKINPTNTNEHSEDTEKIYTAIFQRKTMRADFSEKENIPEEVQKKIRESAYSDITVHCIQDRIRRLMIAEFQGQADGFVINSTKFSLELGDWLIPNDTQSYIGMPGFGFGLQDEQAKRMHEALTGKQKLEPEDGLKFAMGGKIGLEKSPLIVFLTSKSDELENWINTGRTMEKIFLLLTANNIYYAVHAGIVEVSLVNKLFAMTLKTTERITALFRVGYLNNSEDATRGHAPRLPIDQIII